MGIGRHHGEPLRRRRNGSWRVTALSGLMALLVVVPAAGCGDQRATGPGSGAPPGSSSSASTLDLLITTRWPSSKSDVLRLLNALPSVLPGSPRRTVGSYDDGDGLYARYERLGPGHGAGVSVSTDPQKALWELKMIYTWAGCGTQCDNWAGSPSMSAWRASEGSQDAAQTTPTPSPGELLWMSFDTAWSIDQGGYLEKAQRESVLVWLAEGFVWDVAGRDATERDYLVAALAKEADS